MCYFGNHIESIHKCKWITNGLTSVRRFRFVNLHLRGQAESVKQGQTSPTMSLDILCMLNTTLLACKSFQQSACQEWKLLVLYQLICGIQTYRMRSIRVLHFTYMIASLQTCSSRTRSWHVYSHTSNRQSINCF